MAGTPLGPRSGWMPVGCLAGGRSSRPTGTVPAAIHGSTLGWKRQGRSILCWYDGPVAWKKLSGRFQRASFTLCGKGFQEALPRGKSREVKWAGRQCAGQGPTGRRECPGPERSSVPVRGSDPLQSIDFSDFMGLIRVRPSGKIAATVVQTRPGQFATMPVAEL